MATSGAAFVVRHTFLELVDEIEDAPNACASGNRCRAFTDTEVIINLRDDAIESTACDSSSDDGASSPSTELSSRSIGAWCDVSDDEFEEQDQKDAIEKSGRCEEAQQFAVCEVPVPATLVLQGIPREYTRAMLCALLDSVAAGCYDFVYLPQAFRKRKNNWASFGYAFVNFCRYQDAQVAMDRLIGFNDWQVASDKILSVVWSTDCHGLCALVERYRNNPVMHHEVHDDCKPIILLRGVRIPFPQPTASIQAPKR